jgi:hypothetical protein
MLMKRLPAPQSGFFRSGVVSLGAINLFSHPFESFGKSRGAAKCL